METHRLWLRILILESAGDRYDRLPSAEWVCSEEGYNIQPATQSVMLSLLIPRFDIGEMDNTERSCRRRLAEETDDDCVKNAGKTLEPR